jgi:hypothetical protein
MPRAPHGVYTVHRLGGADEERLANAMQRCRQRLPHLNHRSALIVCGVDHSSMGSSRNPTPPPPAPDLTRDRAVINEDTMLDDRHIQRSHPRVRTSANQE